MHARIHHRRSRTTLQDIPRRKAHAMAEHHHHRAFFRNRRCYALDSAGASAIVVAKEQALPALVQEFRGQWLRRGEFYDVAYEAMAECQPAGMACAASRGGQHGRRLGAVSWRLGLVVVANARRNYRRSFS